MNMSLLNTSLRPRLSNPIRALLFFTLLLLSTMSVAFSQTYLLNESFSSTSFPTGWAAVINSGTYNWEMVDTTITTLASPKPVPQAYDGRYLVRFRSYNASSGYSADLRTSVLDFSAPATVRVYFWMFRDNGYSTYFDKVEVYVNTSQTSTGGTLLGTINRSRSQSPTVSADGWYQYYFDVDRKSYKGSTNYIIFKATSAFGNNIYVDLIQVVSTPIPPDAGITAFTSPVAPFNSGTYPVKATLKNFSELNLTSCYINWSVNGVPQPQYYWTGNLAQNNTAEITLGNYNFSYPANGPFNPFTVVASTSLPNGKADGDGSNDQYTKAIAPILNDAGITSIFGPPQGFPPGTGDVYVRIKNYAPKPLTSVNVSWSVDGAAQTSRTFTGLNVLSGQTVDLLLGQFNFVQVRDHDMFAKTNSPNGVADEVTTNDSYTGKMGPSLSPGNFTVGGSGATFTSVDAMIEYLNTNGIYGNGILNVEIRPGYYYGQLDMNNFAHGNNQINFYSSNLDPNSVVIDFTPTNAKNYVFLINNIPNVNFKGLSFTNSSSSSANAGRIFTITNSNNITFTNCNFTGVAFKTTSDNFNLIDFNGSNTYSFANCYFNYGAKAVYDQIYDPCTRNIEISGSTFSGQSFAGVYMMGYMTSSCPARSNNVHIHDNVFKSASGFASNYGVWSMNGATDIHRNSFTGMNSGNVIAINNDPANTDKVMINENAISGATLSNGIYLSKVYDYEVKNNQINLIGGNGQFGALYFMNSGSGSQYPPVSNNSINVIDAHGAYLVSSNVKFVYNNVVTKEVTAPGNQAGLHAEMCRGNVSDNMIAVQNDVGLELYSPMGFELYYNSVVTTGNYPTFEYNGSNSTGAIMKRNIFMNNGSGLVMNIINISSLTSDYNDWYTFGSKFGNNYNSFSNWVATGHDQNSVNVPLTFKSATDLHFVKFDGRIYVTYPLFEGAMYTEIEKYDIDNEWRRLGYYYGADNIEPKVNILDQPDAIIACSNGTTGDATFTVMATVSFGGEPIYQWQKDGKDIPGATSAIYKILQKDLGYSKSGEYHCVISGTGGAEAVNSEVALLYVLTDPLITREPQPVIANTGETVLFEVQAHTYDYGVPVEKFSYQWYRGDLNNPLVNNARVAGADASVLIIKDIKATDYGTDYFCVVSGLCGLVQTQMTGIMLPPDVNITEDPADIAACQGEDATFKVNAEIVGGGTELSYQWMKDGSDLSDGGRISGATTSELTIALIIKGDEGKYSCKATVHPGESSKTSGEAQLTVKEKPVITTQPVSTLTVQAGRELSLTVAATGTDPLGYQWYFEENSIPGEINPTITIPAATTADAGTYYCVVSNECGEIESDESEVTVNNQNQTSVSEVSSNGFTLFASVPNPVSDRSVISFVAPESVNARLTLTDALGNDVAVLFDGITNNGRNDVKLDLGKLNLSSGVYYYTLTSQSFRGTMKLVISR